MGVQGLPLEIELVQEAQESQFHQYHQEAHGYEDHCSLHCYHWICPHHGQRDLPLQRRQLLDPDLLPLRTQPRLCCLLQEGWQQVGHQGLLRWPQRLDFSLRRCQGQWCFHVFARRRRKKPTARMAKRSSSSSSGAPPSTSTPSCAFGSLPTTPSSKSCLHPLLAVNIAAFAELSTGTFMMNGWARMAKPWSPQLMPWSTNGSGNAKNSSFLFF